jgi:hypothetical protein
MATDVEISAECIEALAYINDEFVKNQEVNALRPLANWANLIREEGLDMQCLLNFFLSNDAISHANNPLSVRQIYLECILCDCTTTEFITRVIEEEGEYSRHVIAIIESLLQQRKAIMTAAGGKMKHPIMGWELIVDSAFLGTMAYATRDAWWPEVKEWWGKKEKEQLIKDVEKNAVENVSDTWIDNHENTLSNYNLLDLNSLDLSKIVLKHTAKQRGITEEEIRQAKMNFEENPEEFMQRQIENHPDIYDLTPSGFRHSLYNDYLSSIEYVQKSVEKSINNELEKFIMKHHERFNPEQYQYRKNQLLKNANEYEIKVAKQTMLDLTKNFESIAKSDLEYIQTLDKQQRIQDSLDAQIKIFEKVSIETAGNNKEKFIMDHFKTWGGKDQAFEAFNDFLKERSLTIKNLNEELAAIKAKLVELEPTTEFQQLLDEAAANYTDITKVASTAEQRVRELMTAYKIFNKIKGGEKDVKICTNEFKNTVEQIDSSDFLAWRDRTLIKVNDINGEEIAEYIKTNSPAYVIRQFEDGPSIKILDDYVDKFDKYVSNEIELAAEEAVEEAVVTNFGPDLDEDITEIRKALLNDLYSYLQGEIQSIDDYFPNLVDDLI